MSKLLPIVSVIIPTHNRPAMLAEAIASARAQTFSDYEIIVVSNGENKDKRQASREVAAAHGCIYLELDEGNVAAARNAGIERAQGEWIAVLDDDDLWKPEKLEAQFAAAGDADVVFSDYETVHANGARNIGLTRPPPDGMTIEEGFLLDNYAGGAASNALLRRHAVLSVGGFDRHLEVSEDWDLWRRLSQAADIIFIPDILSVRREHQSNMSRQQIKMIWGKVYVYRKNLQSLPPHLEHMRWRIRLAMLKCLMRLAPAPIYWSGLRPRTLLNVLAGREIFKW